MYDIIGDIHGHAEALKELLIKLAYQSIRGVWQHPERKVIFVGDYIDRGPAIRETLQIVRTMADNEKAIALMGNHNTMLWLMLMNCRMDNFSGHMIQKIPNNIPRP